MTTLKFELHFWKKLENILLDCIDDLTPVLDSPARFSLDKIKDNSNIKQYGLVFNKIQIFFLIEGKKQYLNIIRDSSFAKEDNGIKDCEEKIAIQKLKFKSKEEAELMAEQIAKNI